jgi:phenylpyruvate tautomerase PptA (4-oxalocrotonate tautomerase family)
MPFVNISLARGKAGEYIEAVSRAVHDALVAELHMKPEDEFQLISQHEPGEMVFNRNFRGGPRQPGDLHEGRDGLRHHRAARAS